MNQQELFKPVPRHKLDSLSREELVNFIELQQKVNNTFQREVERLQSLNEELKQRTISIEDEYITIKNKLFGKSSEKESSGERGKKGKKGKRKRKVQLPSERYPDAPLIERDIELKTPPGCPCCGTDMKDSGMTEDSEFLTTVPKQFIVIRQRRHKYRCGKCHGSVKTTPAPPRIKDGSGFSDEMIIDIALSKYCDLIPVGRYSVMAGRQGLMDLPPHTLIGQTHYLADFVNEAYERLKMEILISRVLHADETPHRMLEGDEKSTWYLWGFSNPNTCYFEIHDTRSGDVASAILNESKCEYLISDVFSGYAKAVKEANRMRRFLNLGEIKNIYCNAHARRKFKEAKKKYKEEAEFYVNLYKKIYRLERIAKKYPLKILRLRSLMRPLFEDIKIRSMADLKGYSSKSSMGKAMSYFLKNYTQFTLFLDNPFLPIDNNPQESLLRSPVVGRKTWYGTHSKRGAKTAAVLFSLVESCKLNGVNPREYFKKLVQDMHCGKTAYTPKEYADNHCGLNNKASKEDGLGAIITSESSTERNTWESRSNSS